MPQAQIGLTSKAAALGLLDHGPNALPEAPSRALWRRFFRQFQSPLIYVLLFALVFDAGSWLLEGRAGVPVEAAAIALVLLLNAGLGTFQEARSERALSQLRALSTPLTWVFRDGRLQQVSSEQIVPGDTVRIEAGERIPADGKTLESSGLEVDESLLTGESLPLEKHADAELSSGALVVRGNGLFRVTRTGAKSTLGRLAGLLQQVRPTQTPLEKRLSALGEQIARSIFALSLVLVAAFILITGFGGLRESILFAIALAVAAVPEGMPAVVTLTLALGVQRMAKHHAIVRRLSAVEA
ncbi:MAG TPA: HAD-IC family P-type ATPase, partial [Polyangiaceae bacterium]